MPESYDIYDCFYVKSLAIKSFFRIMQSLRCLFRSGILLFHFDIYLAKINDKLVRSAFF